MKRLRGLGEKGAASGNGSACRVSLSQRAVLSEPSSQSRSWSHCRVCSNVTFSFESIQFVNSHSPMEILYHYGSRKPAFLPINGIDLRVGVAHWPLSAGRMLAAAAGVQRPRAAASRAFPPAWFCLLRRQQERGGPACLLPGFTSAQGLRQVPWRRAGGLCLLLAV